MPKILEGELKSLLLPDPVSGAESDSSYGEEDEKKEADTEFLEYEYPKKPMLVKGIRQTFAKIDEELNIMPEDIRYSGSTCTSVLMVGKRLYVANLGDSRIILLKQGHNKDLPIEEDIEVKQISKDHNLKDDEERARVIKEGGRIDFYRDKFGNQLGPPRVWLQTEHSPGLAMTRSFGDALAHSIGCTSTPDVTEIKLHSRDKMLILASDGIWEFLSNLDVGLIVYPFYLANDPEGAAEHLMRAAHDQWSAQESGSIDDITCVIIFLSDQK